MNTQQYNVSDIKLKITWNGIIRRVSVPQSLPFDQLVAKIRSLFGNDGLIHTHFSIKYQDEDGDMVTVSSNEEWAELKRANKIIKIVLFQDKPNSTERSPGESNKYHSHRFHAHHPYHNFSQVPHPFHGRHPLFRYIQLNNNQSSTQSSSLQQIINLKKWNQLHELALKQMESNSFEGLVAAKESLLESLNYSENNRVSLYNLACVEALLGRHHEALSYLRRSIENGYSDYEHIENDEDLVSLRNDTTYQHLVHSLKVKAYRQQQYERCRRGIGGRGYPQHRSPYHQQHHHHRHHYYNIGNCSTNYSPCNQSTTQSNTPFACFRIPIQRESDNVQANPCKEVISQILNQFLNIEPEKTEKVSDAVQSFLAFDAVKQLTLNILSKGFKLGNDDDDDGYENNNEDGVSHLDLLYSLPEFQSLLDAIESLSKDDQPEPPTSNINNSPSTSVPTPTSTSLRVSRKEEDNEEDNEEDKEEEEDDDDDEEIVFDFVADQSLPINDNEDHRQVEDLERGFIQAEVHPSPSSPSQHSPPSLHNNTVTDPNLQLLEAMGFSDIEKNVIALNRADGDLSHAVNILINYL
eukprot:TRINITY_DN3161_c5_g1_i1.p1 TRINITY_DN3161_c5_g1~~TRINITY_DN3161_c5_g1_i1.p1  ORF type:complete len:579 (-),score=177.39 TRINITY_DN3161_c5_g1_i1:25-1761(-)